MAGELPRRPRTRPLRAVPAPEADPEKKIRAEYIAEVRTAGYARDYLRGRAAAAYAELITSINLNYQASVRRAQDKRANRLAELGTQESRGAENA